MAYFVDRVVSCHAFSGPERHDEILPGGRSKRFLASAKDAKGGTASLVGRQESLLEDELPTNE